MVVPKRRSRGFVVLSLATALAALGASAYLLTGSKVKTVHAGCGVL